MKRDGNKKSAWQTEEGFENSTINTLDIVYDVLVVGGGITGVSTAYRLQRAGKKCILAEAHNLGFGTTGGTTAHLNNFFDTPYNQVESDFGKENAQLLAYGAQLALDTIKENISENNIDCDFTEHTAYIFSLDDKQDESLQKLVDSSNELGVEMGFINDSPFPIPYKRIASVPGQAQFHPIKYIHGLARAFVTLGGVILENCRVEKTDDGDIITAHTPKGEIRAKNLFYATHIPPGVNLLHFRCAPYRSYAIACTLKDGKYPQALGYDMDDPYHYYRTHRIDGMDHLIAGGEDHKTGDEENTENCFRKLEAYVRKYYQVDKVAYQWSSQYFEPVDGLPYIGNLPGNPDNYYCATGFSGNGMIYGTISSLLISEMIMGATSAYAKLFDPSRIKPVAGFHDFVKEAADVVGHFIGDRFKFEKIDSIGELSPGEGKLVKHDGHQLAVYKDESGKVHGLNAACTHVKCIIAWNSAEKSWDCPCHGSRFDHEGTVITGPARKNLEKLNVQKE